MEDFPFDPSLLKELVTTVMPYGKYAGHVVADIPEHYLVWMAREGFPKGKLGQLLALMYEIRLNGLEGLLAPLKQYRQYPH
ncbi:DUF3820 family protein [Cellvibrio japonicus]|uniref:Conserved protein n=1 Tax=Cellvibrio japonicus (strain Ueda107) TaxID=498211 RepID=B3PCW4_CELJU|nr:DUF3820 family protein [Cellvibrio japonicus]ACE84165.1 conserved protein [Cellvibrio japonicus Ueda107]QEI11911.1 DUF3820 family protein [Cellvibrio japonicus]QEI15485.1 DUF3820 family protein [Cellvibrio japonicus]QEI19064.1 DUF3820 family protein [Cellvibrio japonicus]